MGRLGSKVIPVYAYCRKGFWSGNSTLSRQGQQPGWEIRTDIICISGRSASFDPSLQKYHLQIESWFRQNVALVRNTEMVQQPTKLGEAQEEDPLRENIAVVYYLWMVGSWRRSFIRCWFCENRELASKLSRNYGFEHLVIPDRNNYQISTQHEPPAKFCNTQCSEVVEDAIAR